MADWQYVDWEEQATDRLRLARIRQHITEVSRELQSGQSTSADGKARTRFDLVAYLKDLRTNRERLEQIPGANGTTNGGVSVARFVEPGVRADEDC